MYEYEACEIHIKQFFFNFSFCNQIKKTQQLYKISLLIANRRNVFVYLYM